MDRRKPEDIQPYEKHVISVLILLTVLCLGYIVARLVAFILHLIGA